MTDMTGKVISMECLVITKLHDDTKLELI